MDWYLPEVKHNSVSYGGPHSANMNSCTYCGTTDDGQPTQFSVEQNLMENLTQSPKWIAWYDHYQSDIIL